MSTNINAKDVVYSVTNRSVHDALLGKQKKLIAGANITIGEDGTISSTGGGGQVIYIIKTNDSTAPSDENVYSAKRVLIEVDAKDDAVKDLRGTDSNFGMVKVDGTSIVSENGVLSATKKHIQLVVKETADYDSELFIISNHLLDDELADIRIARKGKWTVKPFGATYYYHNKRGYRCMKGNQTDSALPYYKLKITAEYYTLQNSMFPNGEQMHVYRLKVTNKNDITQSIPLTSGNLLEWFVFNENAGVFYVKNGKKRKRIDDCESTDRSIHTIHFGIGINGGTTILPFDIKIRSYMFKAEVSGGSVIYKYKIWDGNAHEYIWYTGGLSNFCDLVVI